MEITYVRECCNYSTMIFTKEALMKAFPILDPVATGARIKELRKEHHLKVEEISEFMGFESVQSIYKWQRGESLPTVDNLYALSVLFETTIDDILRGNKEEDELSSSFLTKFNVNGNYLNQQFILKRIF